MQRRSVGSPDRGWKEVWFSLAGAFVQVWGVMGMSRFSYQPAAASYGSIGIECFCHCTGLVFLTHHSSGDSIMQVHFKELKKQM